jgi:hypothetical protein
MNARGEGKGERKAFISGKGGTGQIERVSENRCPLFILEVGIFLIKSLIYAIIFPYAR